MEKVYIVYYDNGMTYEDYEVSVNRVFMSKESADKYVEEMNAPIKGPFKCSMTEEEYYKQNPEDIHCSYQGFYAMQQYDWMMYSDAKYFVTETDVHP